MKNLQESNIFTSCFNKFKEIRNNKVVVCVSGGIDSLCLLLTLNEWSKKNNTIVIAVTVDHKLRESSTKEANYVRNICKKFNIEHHILTWNEQKNFANIEAKAREKRYSLISDFCKVHDVKYIVTAHHLEDQAETFFIRLFRGSSIEGLSSMQEKSELFDVTIIRPFLNIHKSVLKKFLINNSIEWIEDESNSDEKYLRNKIRNFLNTFNDKEVITERIGFAISEINKCREEFLEQVKTAEKDLLKFESDRCIFYVNNIFKYKNDIVLRLLSQALMRESGNIYKPRFEKLKRLFGELVKFYFNKDVKFKYTFYGCTLESDNDKVIIYREYNSIQNNVELKYNEEIIWDNRYKIVLRKNIKGIKVTHLSNGEFNKFLEYVRLIDFKIFKKLKELKNINKSIFYTIPLIKDGDDNYIINCNFIEIQRNKSSIF